MESNDGAVLIDSNMSYSVNQNEYILNSVFLSNVIDVQMDKNNNTAVLLVVLIRKKVYDVNYNDIKKFKKFISNR